jgi:hypothetical protein
MWSRGLINFIQVVLGVVVFLKLLYFGTPLQRLCRQGTAGISVRNEKWTCCGGRKRRYTRLPSAAQGRESMKCPAPPLPPLPPMSSDSGPPPPLPSDTFSSSSLSLQMRPNASALHVEQQHSRNTNNALINYISTVATCLFAFQPALLRATLASAPLVSKFSRCAAASMWCEDNYNTCDKTLQRCCDSSTVGGCCSIRDEACRWCVNGTRRQLPSLIDRAGFLMVRSKVACRCSTEKCAARLLPRISVAVSHCVIALQPGYPPATVAAIVLVCLSVIIMLGMILYLKYFQPIKLAMLSKYVATARSSFFLVSQSHSLAAGSIWTMRSSLRTCCRMKSRHGLPTVFYDDDVIMMMMTTMLHVLNFKNSIVVAQMSALADGHGAKFELAAAARDCSAPKCVIRRRCSTFAINLQSGLNGK